MRALPTERHISYGLAEKPANPQSRARWANKKAYQIPLTQRMKEIRDTTSFGAKIEPGSSHQYYNDLRWFDQKHPVGRHVAALGTIAVFSIAIGGVMGGLVDLLAHLTERKNDKVGEVVGIAVGLMVALTHGSLLYSLPKKFEMWARVGDFHPNSMTPAGVSRRVIEERFLPALCAIKHNAMASVAVSHDGLVITDYDMRETLHEMMRKGISLEHGKKNFLYVTKTKPTNGHAYVEIEKEIPFFKGLKPGDFVVSKYKSLNHFLQVDFKHTWDAPHTYLENFLQKVKARAQQATSELSWSELQALRAQARENLSAKSSHSNGIAENNPDLEAEFSRLKKIAASQKVIDASVLRGEAYERAFNQVASELPTLGATKKKDSAGAVDITDAQIQSAQAKLQKLNAGIAKRIGSMVASNPSMEYTDHLISALQNHDPELYDNLRHDIYGVLADKAGLISGEQIGSKTIDRVDELTKVIPAYEGLRPVGMHTAVRNFIESFSLGYSRAANPVLQAGNAGISILMYLPIMLVGTVIAALGLGISSTGSSTPVGGAATEAGGKKAQKTDDAGSASLPVPIGSTISSIAPVTENAAKELPLRTSFVAAGNQNAQLPPQPAYVSYFAMPQPTQQGLF